jgi:hypothetical protein
MGGGGGGVDPSPGEMWRQRTDKKLSSCSPPTVRGSEVEM